jgi:Xaa-Pro aminopeptidase
MPRNPTKKSISTRKSTSNDATAAASPSIPLAEFAKRREKVLAALGKSVGVVFAGDAVGENPFRPHAHFEYLTGVDDEPGAVLLLDPTNPVAANRAVLFLRPLDPELERWDGLRESIGGSLKARYGFGSIQRLRFLARSLNAAALRSRRLACLHPPAAYDAPLSPDLALFRQVAERIPGLEIVEQMEAIPKLRAVKSASEVELIRRAGEATKAGFLEALRTIRPGANEFEVEAALDRGYRAAGSRRHAYRPIVGTGLNAAVLHYHANNTTIAPGDLVLIDSGAELGGYASDVTRTYPADGVFTKRQRELYEIVLAALDAGIKACVPGKRLSDMDAAARKVIADAGYGEYFIHGAGHHLGLQVHDANPDEPMKAGAVVTVEPGIYIPEERLGIRIEDDIEVTAKGPRNLTASIPKTVAEIERIMKRG